MVTYATTNYGVIYTEIMVTYASFIVYIKIAERIFKFSLL